MKPDPEKVRAWQQGLRVAALERLRAKERRERDRVREAARLRSEKREAVGERPARPTRRDVLTPRQRLARIGFKPAVSARRHRCVRCERRRADEWHHFLPQAQIKRYVLGRLRELGIERAIELLRGLLADGRNLVALCRDCHDAHEHTSARLTAEDVPSVAHEFAAELGPEWSERLRRMYPTGRQLSAMTREGGST